MAKRMVGYRVTGGELAPRAYAIYEDVPETMGANMTDLSIRNGLVASLRAVDHTSVEDCFVQSPLFERAAKEIECLSRELLARKECARRGLDPDDDAADGATVWRVVDQERSNGLSLSGAVNRLVAAGYLREDAEDIAHEQCPKCGGDCSAANPPVFDCPMIGCNKDF
ncbi:hypothetical protein [Afipia felis]|jgi:hypothetical protein|uniref:Uncharacterized protein n=2 Tax=Afipia felis TaxID=1035 RepID=A0A380WB51_AFIFE|nr:hypothetical protein [Afipia felis]EKS29253.1 hypothetical protein HMPREF9697_01781 [Afipia felis ATCC 53690]SUU77961.1 Uncharacterised protein [Afipia felis]SUU86026.1 Uncharacterised protein [Afipia felis]